MKNKTLSLIALANLLVGSPLVRLNAKKNKKTAEVDLIQFAKDRKVNKRLAKGQSKEWIRIVNNAASREATIYIYDEISWFGVLAEDVIEQIEGLDVDLIHVRINSPGGSVFEGVAIANLLKAHSAKIHTYNDSLCASIATIIFLAGDVKSVADNSIFMIHKPSSIVWGTAEEMRKEAEVLDVIEGTLLTTYENGSTLGRDELATMLEAETYLDAEACVSHGFADEEFSASKMAAKADRSSFDFSAFKNAPEELLRNKKSETGLEASQDEQGSVNETPSLALLKLEAETLSLK